MVANEFQLYITNIFQNAVGDSPGIPAERNMMGRNAEFGTLAGGELNAQFRQAIRLVGRNIMDPNMDPAASRGITVTLSFKPRGDGTVGLGFKVVPKLAGPAKVETTLLIGQDVHTGQVEMREPGEISRPVVVEAEEVKSYDPETGEIYEQQQPIDLRARK